ncbi:hypothetical protein COO51_01775 [Yersinia enterocolitica]|nr:hypothetical protein COO51_01775 [Yersinia enterocolitica]
MATLNNPNHLQHSKLIGILSLAAFLQLELFRAYALLTCCLPATPSSLGIAVACFLFSIG